MRQAVAIAKMTAGPGVTINGVPPWRMCAKKPRKLRPAATRPTTATHTIDTGFI